MKIIIKNYEIFLVHLNNGTFSSFYLYVHKKCFKRFVETTLGRGGSVFKF